MYKSPEPENIKENCDLFIRRKNAQCGTLSTNDPFTPFEKYFTSERLIIAHGNNGKVSSERHLQVGQRKLTKVSKWPQWDSNP